MEKIIIDGIEAFAEHKEKYLQLNDCTGADILKIWGTLQSAYRSYEKCFCFRNCEIPREVMEEIGATLLDDSIEMRLPAHDLSLQDTLIIQQVNKDNFDEFALIHDRIPDMYWTSRRLKEKLSHWGIFVLYEDEQITGYIIISLMMSDSGVGEIFTVVASDSNQATALIARAVQYAFDNGKKEVLFMVDENTPEHHGALALGFTPRGFYQGYQLLPTE